MRKGIVHPTLPTLDGIRGVTTLGDSHRRDLPCPTIMEHRPIPPTTILLPMRDIRTLLRLPLRVPMPIICTLRMEMLALVLATPILRRHLPPALVQA